MFSFSYYFCLMIEGSGSISLTNGFGCGSERPKNIWILRNTSFYYSILLWASVADPGYGAFLTPGSGIRNRFFPDPGSQSHIFESLVTIFWAKKFYNSLKIGPNFFLQHLKNKIIFNFEKFVATKKV
jgi:hypothetical protein